MNRKVLFVVLGVLVVGVIVTGILVYIQNKNIQNEQNSLRNVNVQALGTDDEKKVGTIIYQGTTKESDVKQENGNQVVNLSSKDSVDGVFNIYYQDVLNRYKTYNVSKKDVTKDEAFNKTSKVITVSGQTGKITITIWGDDKGMTQIQIVTTSDFK